MDLANIKSELYDFTDKLYNRIGEGLNEASNINEVNEIIEEEYNNLNDYKKVVKFNTISKIKEEILNKEYTGDAIKKALEIESKVMEIDILHIKLDEEKVYINEDRTPIIGKEESEEKKYTKAIIVVLAITVGAVFGWIVKRGILDAIIMGFIGAAMGYAIYEMSLGEDNKNLEKLIQRDRIINKRIDINYLNTVLYERKSDVETCFLNYINEFDKVSEEI